MRLLAALLFALAIAAPSRAARADEDLVARAKAAMGQLDFDAAIALLEQAEASGKNQPAEMAEIYRATAESHAAMGRGDAAETAFRRLLALDPSVELPAGSSPKLTGPFNAARDFLAGRRIAVECRRAAGGASLVVKSDPVDLVAGARLLTADGAAIGEDAKGRARVALAAAAGTSPAACAALDRHGNLLARVELAGAPDDAGTGDAAAGAATGPVVTSGPAEQGGRPLYMRWWLYAGLGAAAGGVAVYYGLKMKQAEDDIAELNAATLVPGHTITYDQYLALEDRGKGYARNANIALVVTGVFAAVSGGLLVHQLVTERQGERAVGVAVLPGGGSLNVTMGF